ncbi:MAG: hypothetical protein GY863_24410 [bacterium]|nr:hypothetical protein [bacterium]
MGKKEDVIAVRVHGVTADPTTNQFLMLLIDDVGKRLLPIVIGQWEAQSIAWNMQGIEMQRPLTHDLFKEVLDTAQLKISRILINELKENTFYAQIALQEEKKTIDIDSRPSDAVAIALRVNAPIFVSEAVIDKAAVKIDDESQIAASEVTLLTEQLQRAIDNEDYEQAAILRDKINEINDKDGNGGQMKEAPDNN